MTPSDTGDRVRRGEPERAGPHRTARSAQQVGSGTGQGGTACPDPAPGAWADEVRRAVEIGYKVVDENVRYGQAVAREFAHRAYGTPRPPHPGGDPTDRFVRETGRLAGAWMESLARLTAANAAAWWPGPAAWWQPPRWGNQDHGGCAEHAFEVTSARPVRASLWLCPDAARRKLKLGPLVVESTGAADNDGVSIEAATSSRPILVRIAVKPGLPAGERKGDVLDADTGEVLGHLVVNVKG